MMTLYWPCPFLRQGQILLPTSLNGGGDYYEIITRENMQKMTKLTEEICGKTCLTPGIGQLLSWGLVYVYTSVVQESRKIETASKVVARSRLYLVEMLDNLFGDVSAGCLGLAMLFYFGTP